MQIQQKSLEYDYMAVSQGQPVRVMPRPHVMGDGEIQSLHTHNCMEFGYCERGSGIFIINNRIVPFREGDVTIMAPGDYHRATSSPGIISEWQWIWVDVEACVRGGGSVEPSDERRQLLTPRHASCVLHEEPGLFRVMQEVVTEINMKNEHYEVAVQALMLQLLILLDRKFGGATPNEDISMTHGPDVQPAFDHILANFKDPIKIEELAALCYMSPSSFRTKFKAATGITPVPYINSIRLKMSETLLCSTDRSILDISIETGFQTLSSYNRLFKRAHGMSPREFRKQHG